MSIDRLETVRQQPAPKANEWNWQLRSLPAADLSSLIGVLRRRKWILILCCLLITGFTTAVVYSLTPLYEATSSVMIDERQPQLGDVEAIVTGMSISSETVQSEVAVILSRDFADRVIQKLKLFENPEFNPVIRDPSGWSELTSGAKEFVRDQTQGITGGQPAKVLPVEQQFDRERVLVINTFLRTIEVTPRGGTLVIDIKSTAQSPETAADVANTIAELYLVDQLEAKYQATKRATDWLTERLAQIRSDLAAAESAVESYRSSAGLLSGGGETTLAQQQMADINTQLTAARIRRTELEARLRQAEGLFRSPQGASASSDVLLSPVIQNLLAQEIEVQRTIADLASNVGDSHPTMISARAQAQNLRTKLTAEIGRVVASLQNDMAVARAQEATFEKSLAELEEKMGTLNSRDTELRILEREAETNRLLYETFLSRFKESQDQEKIQQSDARIISRADVPFGPSIPNKPMLIALAAVGSVLFGLLIVGAREMFDRGLRSMEEVYQYLGLPCFGLVPVISTFRLAGKSPEAYAVKKPASAYAEAIRSITTGILLTDAKTKPHVIAVTSARPNEGKTAIAISMAALNALGGRRSIILDLDLRKPEIQTRLRSKADHGLVDYLTGQAGLTDVIQKDEASGLDYITAGRRTANFAEVIRSSKLENLLSELGQQYDLVVLDTPPVLAVADTRLLARLADKTLLVVRWGDTARNVVRLALRQISDAGADVAGIAISMVDVRRNAKYGFGDSAAFTGAFKQYYAG